MINHTERWEEIVCDFLSERRGQENDPLSISVGDSLFSFRAYADAFYIPIIRPETERLLSYLIAESKPKRILEVGTAIGYSTLMMHRALPSASIDTIEIDPALSRRASHILENNVDSSRIRFIIGDATDPSLPVYQCDAHYDFVFLDAAKGKYQEIWNAIEPSLKDGCIVFHDNASYATSSIHDEQSRSNKRYETIEKRMHEYVNHRLESNRHPSIFLDWEDGILLTKYHRYERSITDIR